MIISGTTVPCMAMQSTLHDCVAGSCTFDLTGCMTLNEQTGYSLEIISASCSCGQVNNVKQKISCSPL